MYSIRELLNQEPNTIREFVLLVLGGLVMAGFWHPDARLVTVIGLIVSNGLGLFYVRRASVSKAALETLTDTTVSTTITAGDKLIAEKTIRKRAPRAKP